MNEIKLKRTLNSIGKACFVKYYYLFKDETLTDVYLSAIIILKEGYKEAATMTRINSAKRIFKNNMNMDSKYLYYEKEGFPPLLL